MSQDLILRAEEVGVEVIPVIETYGDLMETKIGEEVEIDKSRGRLAGKNPDNIKKEGMVAWILRRNENGVSIHEEKYFFPIPPLEHNEKPYSRMEARDMGSSDSRYLRLNEVLSKIEK